MEEARQAPAPVGKLVCFSIGDQEFGVPIEFVVETLELKPITKVFLTPEWILGIINLRGDIVAVLDLGRLMGMKATAITDHSRIVIVEQDGRSAGVVVDTITELRGVDLSSQGDPASTRSEEAREIIIGLATIHGGRALGVLNLEALFNSERVRSLARE